VVNRFGLPKRIQFLYLWGTLASLSLTHPLRNQLGKDLKIARKTQRLTQANVAAKTGLSSPTIGMLERSQGNLSSWNKVIGALGLVLEGGSLPAADSIGKRVAALRKRQGFGQREFAEIVSITQPTLVRLERHNRGRLDTLERILVTLEAGARLVSENRQTSFFVRAGNSSAHHGWETPQWLLKTLYAVVGTFDLDPCSATRNRRKASVRARKHFTMENNGLKLPWCGKVFVNPPYGREIGLWTAKAKSEVQTANAQVVIGLLPSRTDTLWWHRDIAGSAVVIFLRGRLRFGNSEQSASAPFPSALIIWGGTPAELDALRAALPNAWHT